MRADMAKVIVNRPRLPGHNARGRRKGRAMDFPSHIGMKRMASEIHGERKSLNENLAPLKRYLVKQAGRPWNDVYSEISKNLRTTSAVQQHVRDHVFDFVANHAKVFDGKMYVQAWGTYMLLEDSSMPLWVDPKSGLLRKNKHQKTARQRRGETLEALNLKFPGNGAVK